MVGAAQYRDDEIDWVLSAVVNKKKQSYIQSRFKDRFGRSLNHNQIRYIKNKYGKDPRFNSPLVNIRPAKAAASPPSSLPGVEFQDGKDGNEGQAAAGPSAQRTGRGHDMSQAPQPRPLPKRKRSTRGDGDDSESTLRHSIKIQRPNPPTHSGMAHLMACNPMADTAPRWNAAAAQYTPRALPHAHSLSPPGATPAETAYASAYDAGPQPLLLQGTSGSISWTPSIPMGGAAMWEVRKSPGLIDTGGKPAALLQNLTSSPANFTYYTDPMPASYAFPSPLATQSLPLIPQPHHTSMPPPQFTPSMPHLTCSPYPQGLGQQQQQHEHNPGQQFNGQATAELNAAQPDPGLEHTPVGACPVPSFEEIPIEDASWDNTPRTGTPAPGATLDWTRITYAPYEPCPFEIVPPPMVFPFENVRYTGLTATSAKAINNALRNAESQRRRGLNAASFRHHLHCLDHDGQAVADKTINPVVTSLDMLNMLRQPPDGSLAPPPPESHLQSFSAFLPYPPSPQAAHGLYAQASVFSRTIDPRLLTEQHVSPPSNSGQPPFPPLDLLKAE